MDVNKIVVVSKYVEENVLVKRATSVGDGIIIEFNRDIIIPLVKRLAFHNVITVPFNYVYDAFEAACKRNNNENFNTLRELMHSAFYNNDTRDVEKALGIILTNAGVDIEALIVKVEGSVVESQVLYNFKCIRFDIDSVKKAIDMKKDEDMNMCCVSNG